jgi:uncharacterized damage-inducible protein DinB
MAQPKFLDIMPSFGMNDFMYNQALTRVTEDQASYKISENTNSFRGIAAHLLISRHHLGNLCDMSFAPLPWTDIGEMMDAGFIESENFPKLSELLEKWQEVTPVFVKNLPQLPDELVNSDSPFKMPNINTLGDFIKLNALHESYHMGQLGLIVRELTGVGIMSPPKDAEA